MELPSLEECLSIHKTCLPNSLYPSDHLALIARFQLTRTQSRETETLPLPLAAGGLTPPTVAKATVAMVTPAMSHPMTASLVV